jgi:hypothetical protein
LAAADLEELEVAVMVAVMVLAMTAAEDLVVVVAAKVELETVAAGLVTDECAQ